MKEVAKNRFACKKYVVSMVTEKNHTGLKVFVFWLYLS